MFVGRKQELQFLEDKYNSKGGQLIVLYGRRRVGKTETLREYIRKMQRTGKLPFRYQRMGRWWGRTTVRRKDKTEVKKKLNFSITCFLNQALMIT